MTTVLRRLYEFSTKQKSGAETITPHISGSNVNMDWQHAPLPVFHLDAQCMSSWQTCGHSWHQSFLKQKFHLKVIVLYLQSLIYNAICMRDLKYAVHAAGHTAVSSCSLPFCIIRFSSRPTANRKS